MKVQFYNSLSRSKQEFVAENPQRIKIYSCGPTVYNYNHIGNFRSYMFVDVLRRSLKLLGYQLEQTMNITDIDDKIIKNSIASQQSVEQFTAKWIKVFFEDLDTLNIERVEHYPRATESIDAMLELMERLEKNGYTYSKDGNLYYSIKKFSEYGALSRIDTSGMVSGTRYDTDEYEKDDIRDFVLWKAPKEKNEKTWMTRFGQGRPGWHLECSAMIQKIYQSGVDIHTGGIDLLFPHHENEIAQSQAAYPKQDFVKYWLHCEHLLVDGQKMAKSQGNFYTLRDLLTRGYRPSAIRYLLLSFHYRTKLNFSLSRLVEAEKAIEKLQNTLTRLLQQLDYQIRDGIPQKYANRAYQDFLAALADDLNVPKALGEVFEFGKTINQDLDNQKLTEEDLYDSVAYFQRVNDLLAVLDFQRGDENLELSVEEIEQLIEERQKAKDQRDYATSDKIRDELLAKGIVLQDSKTATTWKKK